MRERLLEVRRLGRVAYGDALELQKELEAEVIAARGVDYLLLLEHPHTFTIGGRGKENGVLATAEVLRSLGVEVFETNRGGKVTYHGLGQILGYPIISLSPDREDVHKYVMRAPQPAKNGDEWLASVKPKPNGATKSLQ